MTSIFLKLAHYYHLSVVASLVEDLKAKHPNLTDKIELLTNADPSRSHKYLRYGVKQLLAGQKLTDILETIKLFHTLSSKLPLKDINQWNFEELQGALSRLSLLGETTSRTQSKQNFKAVTKEVATKGADILYQDERCTLLFVANKAEACFYGQDTDWCLTMDNDRYFEDYQANNAVFYYLLRQDLSKIAMDSKIAIAILRDQHNQIFYKSEELTNIPAIRCYDKNDQLIPPSSIFHGLPDLWPLIKQDAEARPMPFMARVKFQPQSLSFSDFQAQFSDRRVREAVAEVTPDPIIQNLLSHDPNSNIQAALAKNPHLSYTLFQTLSHSSNSLILMELLNNPKLPEEIRREIFTTTEEEGEATERPTIPAPAPAHYQ